jgi:hypothetical protein
MFCSPTGQTGKDAYIYEAAQIANEQRELDKRFRHLRATVAEENPDLFENPTDFAFTANASHAAHFLAYLLGKEDEFLKERYNR